MIHSSILTIHPSIFLLRTTGGYKSLLQPTRCESKSQAAQLGPFRPLVIHDQRENEGELETLVDIFRVSGGTIRIVLKKTKNSSLVYLLLRK